VIQKQNRWALPHVSVPSVAWLDWEAIRRAGFAGCVFDKDNTLTEPYAEEVAAQLLPSLRRCQKAFDGRLVLFSNSVGLSQFDPHGAALLPEEHRADLIAYPLLAFVISRCRGFIPASCELASSLHECLGQHQALAVVFVTCVLLDAAR
jgi:hypothetical protein